MKKIAAFALFLSLYLGATAQTTEAPVNETATKTNATTVDASCGQCKFGLKGKGCNLAVRIYGKAYFVDGSDIDSHGDAHANDGFCNKIRKAEVQGEIVNNRYKATHFKLLPEVKAKKSGE